MNIQANMAEFEAIRKLTQSGAEWWSARELQHPLGYALWQNFSNVLRKAMAACESAGMPVKDHFIDIDKMVLVGKGGQRELEDGMLSRHACYLIATNVDPCHPKIAAAQSYFVIQMRKQEMLGRE